MESKIRRILEAAIQAPSGDNCQPWKLRVRDLHIDLYNRPERDQSLYNYQQQASYVAHGALLENLTLAAAMEGFGATIRLFPVSGESNLVASVDLAPGGEITDPLAEHIYERGTNRNAFDATSIGKEHIKVLTDCADGFDEARIIIATGIEDHRLLSSCIAKNDWLVFENRPLHDFLFEQIRWSKNEAEMTRDGLDIKTLGLSKSDRLAFPILKHWALVKSLNFFGLARMIGRKAEQVCRNSAHVGAVIVRGDRPEDFVRGGRVMQRVWLQSTALKLQFQPYAGIAFLLQRGDQGQTLNLSKKSKTVLNRVAHTVTDIFNLREKEVVVMFFRLGAEGPLSRKSLRLKFEDVVSIVAED